MIRNFNKIQDPVGLETDQGDESLNFRKTCLKTERKYQK